jgi:predicted RNA-binding Zn ribbon-like protein
MEPLDLDPGQYQGTYKLIGGQLSLDLINTVSWPGTNREHDWLEPATNLTVWGQAVGLIDNAARDRIDNSLEKSDGAAKAQVESVKSVRTTLRDAIWPLAIGEVPTPKTIRRLNQLLEQTSRQRFIDPETLQWRWATPTTVEGILAPVVWNAGEVMTGVDPQRLGRCPSCDWLFHDTTRNRSRRWCDMGDCGSRDKALRYYHRNKT